MSCQADLSFGPATTCRPFDFTLVFEQSILTVLPNGIFVLLAAARVARVLLSAAIPLRRFLSSLASASSAGWTLHAFLGLATTAIALHCAMLALITDDSLQSVVGPVAHAAAITSLLASLALIPLHIFETAHDLHAPQRSSGDLSLPFLLITSLIDAVILRTYCFLPPVRASPLFALHIVALATKLGLCSLLNAPAPTTPAPLTSWFSVVENRTAEERASLLSRLLFIWLLPTIWLGFRRPLTLADLEPVPTAFRGEKLGAQLSRYWDNGAIIQERVEDVDEDTAMQAWASVTSLDKIPMTDLLPSTVSAPRIAHDAVPSRQLPAQKVVRQSKSLLWALIRAFLGALLLPAVPQAAYTAAQLTVPFLVSDTIAFAQSYAPTANAPQPDSHGWGLVGAWVLVYLVIALSAGQLAWSLGKAEVKLRGALIEVVYEKSLRLSLAAAHGCGGGAASNLLSVDTERIVRCIGQFHTLWSGVVQIAIGTYLLYLQIGWSFVSGLITVLVCIVITPLGSRGIEGKQTRWSSATDARVNLVASVLAHIQGIKLMAYESVLLTKLRAYRQKEIDLMRTFLNQTCAIGIWTNAVSHSMLLSMIVTMFVVDRVTGSKLVTTNSVFTAMTIVGIVQNPILMIGQDYAQILTALSSITRIEDFNNQADAPVPSSKAADRVGLEPGEAVRLTGASIGWKPEAKAVVLRDVNLSIPQGKLTMICGRTATGKSTLLAALLGETTLLAGACAVSLSSRRSGGVVYVSQDAWDLQALSVRANILFGATFDSARYARVLAATALDVDMRNVPDGDAAKAKTLSGGQRQRLGLARGLYRYEEADTYIMDDFLSALDAETAAHVWASILGPDGMLNGKTVVMATNATHLLAHAALVVRLGRGTVDEAGSFEHLSLKGKAIVERASIDSKRSAIGVIEDTVATTMIGDGPQDDDIEESRTSGVQWATFDAYIQACGRKTFYWGMVLSLVQGAWSVALPYELQFWTQSNDRDYAGTNQGAYLSGFVLITVGFVLWMGTVVYYSVWFMSARGGLGLHERLLRGLLRAPISFFAKMPAGALLSRFSQDIYYIDTGLSWEWLNFSSNLRSTVLAIVQMAVAAPPMIAVAFVMLLCYLGVQRLYIGASRQLRRLEMATKSPIYALIGESSTPAGLATIRAFQQSQQFRSNNTLRLDLSQRPYSTLIATRAWLQMVVNLLALLMNSVLVVIVVLLRSNPSVGLLAVALTRAALLSAFLNQTLVSGTELEIAAVAIERVNEMAVVGGDTAEVDSLDSKPSNQRKTIEEGSIVFDNVTAHYESHANHNVLEGVSFSVNPGERFGICGRSGAGKSSVLMAIFGALQVENGFVQVGGHDLTQWELQELRSNMAMIPQNAIILHATVRENLDPDSIHTDEELWEALRKCNLAEWVRSKEARLETELGGETVVLSPGQRQLFSFARAILRKRKILCMDESTSSLDEVSDKEIQKILRRDDTFDPDCTVVTIAHRIASIIDSDRVMVLSQGQVVELGTPAELLANKNSIFYSLAKEQRCVR